MDRFQAYMTFGNEFLEIIFLLLSKNHSNFSRLNLTLSSQMVEKELQGSKPSFPGEINPAALLITLTRPGCLCKALKSILLVNV